MDDLTLYKILSALENSGFHNPGIDLANRTIVVEDPTCIARTFESFLNVAWIAILVIAGVLLFGWAISLIRGAKNDLFTNMRNLMFIFLILAAILPMVKNYLLENACVKITADLDEVIQLSEQRQRALQNRGDNGTFEILDIQDTGLQIDITSDIAE